MRLKGITRGRRDHESGEPVRTLTPADIGGLAISSHPRLQDGDAEAMVIQAPGLSKWHPQSGDFILVTPWRHRPEIPSIGVSSAFRHEDELISAVLDASEKQGSAAFVLLETYETRRPTFYEKHGLNRIEQIITYEHGQPEQFLMSLRHRRQQFFELTRESGVLGEKILEVDHGAFPWLWWNSAEEFTSYLRLPNTGIWAGMIEGEVVSYVGFTHYRNWSHLDRIAIRPDVQRKGYGREALHFAVERMVEHGATTVGLSTQGNNAASRRMYESVGFRATPENDYDVFGIIFPSGRRLVERED